MTPATSTSTRLGAAHGYRLVRWEAPRRAAHLSGSVGVLDAPDHWLQALRTDGAEPVRRPDAPDHLLVLYPSIARALEVAQARSGRRGSTWAVVAPSPEGAAALAVIRAAAVEGDQRVHGVAAVRWPEPSAIRSWMESHPRRSEGLGHSAQRLRLVEPRPLGPPVQLHGGSSPMGRALVGGSGPMATVLDAPDRPLCALRAEELSLAPLAQALAGNEPVVVGTDDLTQRPGSVPSAVLAAAAAVALAEAPRPWLRVGPVGEGPRVVGIAGLEPEEVRRRVLGGSGEIWLDVDWSDALAAFPHLADLAGHLLGHPTLRRGRAVRAVCAAAEAVLGRAVPADRPLAELGLDSLGAEELRQRLVEQHGVMLPLTLALEHPTAAGMGERLAQETKGAR